MADRQLSEKLTSGEIVDIKLRGTGSTDSVATIADINTAKDSVTALASRVTVIEGEVGWKDNVAMFIHKNATGIVEPAYVDMGNGLYAYNFTDGEALTVMYHIMHDVKPNGETYFHVHFAPKVAMNAGETLTWTVTYRAVKGYHQGETFTGAANAIVLTYTADGTELAGEHLILEAGTPIVTPEVDSIIAAKAQYHIGTYTGSVYGYMMDMHYQSDRDFTNNKNPDFYGEPV